MLGNKLRELLDQLEALAQSKKISCEQLERALGLLMWATSARTHVRLCMASLYRDLRNSKGTYTPFTPGTGVASWMHLGKTQSYCASQLICGSQPAHRSSK